MNKKFKTILLALLVMLLWGSLFPCVKMGYSAFHIDTSKISNILMFAAMRFTVCGGLVTIYCTLNRKKTIMPTKHDTFNILLVGLFAIILHYACTYIGLSLTDSSKTALLKQAGALIYICFAFLFFKDERFSVYKIIGAIVGFSGIIAINFSSSEITFSYGDLLILGASVCTVVSNIISRKSSQQCSPLWITGISQLFGGIILFILSFSCGGAFPQLTINGVLVFAYICTASIISYTLWYHILKTNELSKLFIIKFAEPLFACFFGAILLGENIFRFQYLLAFILISLGIVIGHKSNEKKAIK